MLVGLLVIGVVGSWSTRDVDPAAADIREVWEHHEMYEGQSLRVTGTLKRFLPGLPKEHFVVESEDGYRIGVEAAGLQPLDGAPVDAVGQVTFDEERGLRLEAASVQARR